MSQLCVDLVRFLEKITTERVDEICVVFDSGTSGYDEIGKLGCELWGGVLSGLGGGKGINVK